MKVTDKLSEADLAERLNGILDRASRGDEFIIERDRFAIAIIRHPDPSAQPSITWGAFLAKYWDLPRPDNRFADDLEAILAERRNATHADATRGTTWEEFAAKVGDLELPGEGFCR